MLAPYLRLTRVSLTLATLLPAVALTCTYLLVLPTRASLALPIPGVGQASAEIILTLVLGIGAALVAHVALERFQGVLERWSTLQVTQLDSLPARWVPVAIAASAALSLLLELTIIRWQGELLPIFAFYKNYSLLVCFAGLGLGYALARQPTIPLVLSLPWLAVQIVVLTVVRYGLAGWRLASVWHTPFTEQLHMGVAGGTSPLHLAAIYTLLAVVFLATALALVPVGQACGRLLGRDTPLRAYGYNLLGSLAGVLLMMAASALWTPPIVWFVVGFGLLLVFLSFDSKVLLAGISAAFLAVVALAASVTPGYERIHSPYQLLERGPGQGGLTVVNAAGHYYQRVLDLARSNANRESDPRLRAAADYYEFAYRVYGRSPARVAVVGAGMGNDVAAALRSGAGAIDAIEIDPAILLLGRLYHPERPYDDPRVKAVVNDARTFLRTAPPVYDVIVFGLLDSHTLLSYASSVRLDSFVYTREALREARQRLRPGGVLSLSFTVLSPELGKKIALMLTEAFDGHPPVCVYAGYDSGVIFLQSREGDLRLPAELVTRSGFSDVTGHYAEASGAVEASTDDWPFFYMPRRVYPLSYLGMIGLILVLSFVLVRGLLGSTPARGGWPFLFLGAGFLLIETKATTELGLSFGNTWQVVGIAIGGVLVMAFLANAAVARLGTKGSGLAFAFLIVSLLAGYAVSAQGGLGSSLAGKLATVGLITIPVLFSGFVFSSLFASSTNVGQAMAMNLLGAMLGGVLEYNAMYFGYRALYLLAIVLYAAAAVTSRLGRRG